MPLPSLDRDGVFSIRWKRSNRRGISAAAIPDAGVRDAQHRVPVLFARAGR